MEPNKLGYIIVCANLNKNQFSKFELEVHSTHRLTNITPNNSLMHKKNNFNIYSKWDKFNSGGALNEISFFRNPQYELNTIKQTDAYIELTSHDNYYISFILVELDNKIELKDLNELENSVLESSLSSIYRNCHFMQEVHSRKLQLKNNTRYFLIPFTKMANQVNN